jgi:hypothetical protein
MPNPSGRVTRPYYQYRSRCLHYEKWKPGNIHGINQGTKTCAVTTRRFFFISA